MGLSPFHERTLQPSVCFALLQASAWHSIYDLSMRHFCFVRNEFLCCHKSTKLSAQQQWAVLWSIIDLCKFSASSMGRGAEALLFSLEST